jgi:lambda family phage portal protein
MAPRLQRIEGARLSGHYEAASQGQRLANWQARAPGPNIALQRAALALAARQRQQSANNAKAFVASEQYVTQVVGANPRLEWKAPNEGEQDAIQELWEESQHEIEVTEQLGFGGMLALVTQTMFDSGSVLIRNLRQRSNSGLIVPMHVQLTEPDHLDRDLTVNPRTGNKVFGGVEVARGKRVSFHVRPNHPGEADPGPNRPIEVPARDMIHAFKVLRPGQLHGQPALTAALIRLREQDVMLDADLIRRQMAAEVVSVIRNASGTANPEDVWGDNRSELLASRRSYYDDSMPTNGRHIVLEPGDDFHLIAGPDSASFAEATAFYDREVAAVAGITYEQLTGDMRNVNYSSARVRLIDVRRAFEMFQVNVLSHQVCRRIARWWLDAAVATGRLTLSQYATAPHKYLPKAVFQAFEHVDPLKDTMADQLEVLAGFASLSSKRAERGSNDKELTKQIDRDNKNADAIGARFTSDARWKHAQEMGNTQFASDDQNQQSEGS